MSPLMPHAADPVSLIAALVAVFGVATLVWLMIAAGLRESPWACASVAGANAMLGASFLLHDALGLTLPLHYWWSDLLSLAGFGLIRLAVPLVGERPAPWRLVLAMTVAIGVLSARFTGGPDTLPHKLLLYGAMSALAMRSTLDAWRLLRARGLNARAALVLASPLAVVGLLLLARPAEALLAPGSTADIDVASAFNIAWLWASLVLALLINGWIAFLLLMKLVLEIRRLTERDPLTDALNRRALSEAIEAEHSRQMRGHGYALVLLDMDRFKQLNDTLGHAAGDAALKAMVTVVRPCLREVDRLARLGGEEFCVLLPHTGIAGAALVAERMRALLAAHPFAWDGRDWPLTASFGIAESSRQDESATEVMRRADQALYRAKAQGRNVVQAVELEPAR
ncbi:GGDEF domain-containing protein [Roseateles sp.]|uniref:GGDEF domain-containing protein n=1 Tax=Roseateles sp. TaxID=1971397 RepID=UPI0031DBBDD7